MMRILTLSVLCVALAVLKTLLTLVACATVLALAYAFIVRPRETLVFVAVVGLTAIAGARPTAAIACLGILGVVWLLSRRSIHRPRNFPRLISSSR